MYKTFYQLPVWQEGMFLLKEVYRISANFPKEERFGLVQDMRRSANSIIANIAESHGRFFLQTK